ncbi:MBL fold metallo-hydrolase [Enterococcus sp. AZ109]|uniref:MBL fold metallo-hydrolase n=1 Tax=Enterococcus sp. AZ109 TaxID=2774634 RepID=UPI003F29984E
MIHIEGFVTGRAQENCYLIYNEDNLLIVDPGSEGDRIAKEIKRTGRKPAAILLTHTHYDHIGAVEQLRNLYHVPVYVSALEQEWLGNPVYNLSGLGSHQDMPDLIVQPAEYEFELKTYTIGGMTFEVVPTPGHSIGSVSFIFDDFVVVGDALFRGSIGRTDLYTGDLQQLLYSIKTYLFTLPRELPAYPGHGEATTIGHEIDTNPFFN